jgi:hypothetical protein
LFRGLVLTFTKRRLTWRRLLFFPLATLTYLIFRLIVRVAQGLDDLFFRGYRAQPVRSPVFVIAFPRSGTTFLHHLMCLDEEKFTYHRTYQTLLPAVSLYKFVGAFTALDRRMTAILPKLVRWFNRDLFSGWRGIHSIGLQRAEEDEGVFLYPIYTPVFYMLFPFMEQFRELEFLDDLTPELRQRIMDFYQGCLQRHMYAVRKRGRQEQRTLLVKNVHSTGRIRSILRRFPDARFVFIMRNPGQAIPSLLSLYYAAWKMHSPDIPKRSPEARALAQMGYRYYRYLQEMCGVIPPEQYICVGFEDLIQSPEDTVERIYGHLGLPLSEAFRGRLQAAILEQTNHRSRHRYSLEEYGIDEQEVYRELRQVFEFLEEQRESACTQLPSDLTSSSGKVSSLAAQDAAALQREPVTAD